MALSRGMRLHNRYRIVDVLGKGGMGSVYRAIDESLGLEVAVKENLFTTEEYSRQFRREAVFLAHARHPGLPRVSDYFVTETGSEYLVMDYIEGEDLRQRMERQGKLSDEEVIAVGAAVCDTLIYLGTRQPPIIHRDIKPGNVRITPLGQAVLVDFGLAKALDGSQMTTTGARAMTPGYSPPEQYGNARTDQRSDIFSLGATLYAAITGMIPEESMARTMGQISLTPVRSLNQRVGRRLAGVIEKAIQVRPEDRYPDAEAFRQALLEAAAEDRRKANDLVIAPPPGMEARPTMEEALIPPELKDLQLEGYAPLPSAPVSQPRPLLLRRRRLPRYAGVITFAALAVVVFLSFQALVSRGLPASPGWQLPVVDPQQVVSSPSQPPPLPSATHSATVTPLPPTRTPSRTPLPSVTVILPPVILLTTPTLLPSRTALPSPTPIGGGAGQVAFASDRSGLIQIHLINIDGSGLKQLTSLPEGACQPSWSPDGGRLVFVSPCDKYRDLYAGSHLFIINADGSGLLPLQTVPGGDFDPAWSPDGKSIAFTSLRRNGRPQLFLYDLAQNTAQELSQPNESDQQPYWSPDGRQILFITARRAATQLYSMAPDGSGQKLVVDPLGLVLSSPAWAPDGRMLIYTQMVTLAGIPSLVLASFPGLQKYPITMDRMPMRDGRFSADGFWIVFEGWAAGESRDLYLIGVNGGGRRAITQDQAADFDPAWRPFVP